MHASCHPPGQDLFSLPPYLLIHAELQHTRLAVVFQMAPIFSASVPLHILFLFFGVSLPSLPSLLHLVNRSHLREKLSNASCVIFPDSPFRALKAGMYLLIKQVTEANCLFCMNLFPLCKTGLKWVVVRIKEGQAHGAPETQ